MKMVIGRLEAPNLVRLDFSLNFGLTSDSKKAVTEAFGKDSYEEMEPILDKEHFGQILIAYKYFSHAHQKISHIFYKE